LSGAFRFGNVQANSKSFQEASSFAGKIGENPEKLVPARLVRPSARLGYQGKTLSRAVFCDLATFTFATHRA
jgi:hypothetical protein